MVLLSCGVVRGMSTMAIQTLNPTWKGNTLNPKRKGNTLNPKRKGNSLMATTVSAVLPIAASEQPGILGDWHTRGIKERHALL